MAINQFKVPAGSKVYRKGTNEELVAQGTQDIGEGQTGQFFSSSGFSLEPNQQEQQTPTPITPPTEEEQPINRPVISDTEQSIADYYKNLNQETPDENSIREAELKKAQAMIDATNSLYDEQLRRAREVGAQNVAETSSISTSAGLSGSPFKTAQVAQTKQYNLREEQSLAAQRQAAIAQIRSNAEARATERFDTERAQILQNKKDYITYLKELQTADKETQKEEYEKAKEVSAAAKSDIKELASTGLSLNEFKKTKEYQQLMLESGYSQLQFDAIYNANLPKEIAVKYEYKELKNGELLRIGDDGSYESIKGADPIPEDFDLVTAPDGTLFLFNKNTGEIQNYGNFAKPESAADKNKAPEVKEINGVDSQWNPETQTWEPITQVNPQAREQERVKVQKVVGLIDDLLSDDKVLNNVVGAISSWLPTVRGESVMFENKFNQLQALLKMDQIKNFKGMGSMSDREFQTATDAASILSLNMSADTFKQALNALKESFSTALVPNETEIANTIQNLEPLNASYSDAVKLTTENPSYAPLVLYLTDVKGLNEGEVLQYIEGLQSGFSNDLSVSLKSSYPEGSVGGQCTTFLHSLAKFPSIGDGKLEKFASVDKFGIKKQNWTPRVGDIIVTDENKTYGHTAMINKILSDGTLVLTESNYKKSNIVSHDRKMPSNSSRIYGAIRPSSYKV